MTLHPLNSLRDQTLVVLLLVLGVSHLISIAIYALDRRSALVSNDALHLAERAAGMAGLLEALPPDRRGDAVRGADGATFRVSMSSVPQARETASDQDLVAEVRRHLGAGPGARPAGIRIGTLPPDAGPAFRDSAGVHRLLQISLQLDDGQWLNATGIIAPADTLWPRPAALYILSDLAAMVAVGIWMVYRVTSPLTTFAEAADRLGKDLRSQPLAESGPEEVAKAARAFNEMQNRLQRMIDNRTEMLAAISHDLRTPITVLALRAENMNAGADRDRLLATLEEMEAMVSSVLDLARETFQEEPSRVVDLSALVQSLCEDMTEAGASIRLTAPDQLRYRCRRLALKRAITNLLDNAVRYAGDATLSLAVEDQDVVIEVLDDGPGYPAGELDDLFTPFFRAERSRSRDTGGTGLGLSIAKAIVESHGGTLRIRNRPEGGARATIRLPG